MMQPQQPQGLWGQLTGQGSGAGLAGNPLFMMGLTMAGGGNPAAGMAAVTQAQNAAQARELRQYQLMQLQREDARRQQQEDAFSVLAGNPEYRKQLGPLAELADTPGMGPVVGKMLLEAQLRAPAKRPTLEDAAGYHRYVDTGERVFPDVVAAPDEPEVWRQKFDLWKSENPDGTYTQYMQETKTPLIGSLWGDQDPATTQGGAAPGGFVPPAPGRTYTTDEVAAADLDPDAVYMTDPKTGIPKKVGQRGQAPLSGEASSRYSLMKAGMNDVRTAYDYFFPRGGFDRQAWLASFVPGSDEKAGRVALRRALRAKLRIESGAQITDKEVDQETDIAMPGMFDSDATVQEKLEGVIRFLYGGLEGLGREGDSPVTPGYFTFNPKVEAPPQPGAIVDGYRFLGGDPNDETRWVPVTAP